MKLVFNKEIKVAKKILTTEGPVFIIAEAGVNHNGSMEKAYELIDIAAHAGVDAVKFQAFKTDELILNNVEKAAYQKETTGSTQSQTDLLRALELKMELQAELKTYAETKGLIFMTTPFDFVSLEELDVLDLDAYKISSTDITNIPFLREVAKKGKPIIISTGMCFLSDVQKALATIHPLNKNVLVMHCTANYPAANNEINLRVLQTYHDAFDILLGYSDHTVGVGASPYAVALGASSIEKHFTIDKTMEGPDHKASLSPEELTEFVREIRKVEVFLGSSEKKPTPSEEGNRLAMQKYVVAKTSIAKNEIFSENNIIPKRTGGKGISATFYDILIGKVASKDYELNEIIHESIQE